MNEFTELFRKKDNILLEPTIFQEDILPMAIVPTKSIRELISEVAKFARDKIPNNILIVGESGAGKTYTARYLNQYIVQLQQQGVVAQDILVFYVNCRDRTATDILTAIYKGELPKTTPEFNHFMQFLNDTINIQKHVLLILDEVDKGISIQNLLYELSRPREYQPQFQFNISLILISNDSKWEYTLDSAIRSSLSLKRIYFENYSVAKLTEILEQKAKIAINEKSAINSKKIFQQIAEKVVKSYHGDSRIAVKTLLYLAQKAEEVGESNLTLDKEILNALPKIKEESEIKMVSLLNEAQFFTLYTCSRYEQKYPISSLYQEYLTLLEKLNMTKQSRTTFYNNIDYLDTHDLIEKEEKNLARDLSREGVKEIRIRVKIDKKIIDSEFTKRTYNTPKETNGHSNIPNITNH